MLDDRAATRLKTAWIGADRTVVGLLVTLNVLLAVLIVGGALGGILLYRQLAVTQRDLDRRMAGFQQQVAGAQARFGTVGSEAAARQSHLVGELAARGARTHAEVMQLEHRRKALSGVQGNVLAKLDQLIKLNQVGDDGMLLLLEHLADTQKAIAGTVAPLPGEKPSSKRR